MNDETNLTVRKVSAYLPVSFELAIDCGVMTENEARARGWKPTPRRKPSWRTRLRWWISGKRERVATWLCHVVAGYEMQHSHDD